MPYCVRALGTRKGGLPAPAGKASSTAAVRMAMAGLRKRQASSTAFASKLDRSWATFPPPQQHRCGARRTHAFVVLPIAVVVARMHVEQQGGSKRPYRLTTQWDMSSMSRAGR